MRKVIVLTRSNENEEYIKGDPFFQYFNSSPSAVAGMEYIGLNQLLDCLIDKKLSKGKVSELLMYDTDDKILMRSYSEWMENNAESFKNLIGATVSEDGKCFITDSGFKSCFNLGDNQEANRLKMSLKTTFINAWEPLYCKRIFLNTNNESVEDINEAVIELIIIIWNKLPGNMDDNYRFEIVQAICKDCHVNERKGEEDAILFIHDKEWGTQIKAAIYSMDKDDDLMKGFCDKEIGFYKKYFKYIVVFRHYRRSSCFDLITHLRFTDGDIEKAIDQRLK